MNELKTGALQAASDSKVFCEVKGHDFEDANNCVFCAKDSVTISRECAEQIQNYAAWCIKCGCANGNMPAWVSIEAELTQALKR
jgi:hypothetical protein